MMGTGRFVVIAGQIGWDADGRFADGFPAQTGQALRNILAVLAEAGGGAEHIARLTWYVTDMAAYREGVVSLGPVWRKVMGRNFPAMAVVGVTSLWSRRHWWKSRRPPFFRCSSDHHITSPPLGETLWPIMLDAASDARNR